MARRVGAVLVSLGLVVAQQPAPTAEGRAPVVWTRAEAGMLSLLHLQRSSLADDDQLRDRLPGHAVDARGSWIGFFGADADGDVVMPGRLAASEPFFVLAWPTAGHAELRFGILMHGDGTILVCEPGDDRPPLSAELVVARGSKGTFADVLRQPGTGGGGHLWMWLDQVAATATVVVVDEHGKPRADVFVHVGPGGHGGVSAGGIAWPGLQPVGAASSDVHGVARLRGPRCEDLRITLATRTHEVLHERVRGEPCEGGIRVVVPAAALISRRVLANEEAAIATLKNISSAQAQCQASGVIDADGDGAGEYGFFGELSGGQPVRTDGKGGVGETTISPPVLSAAFQNVANGRVQRSGYLFQIWLPGKDQEPVGEAAGGGAKGVAVAARAAEVLWCAYAWPADPDSGVRAFFVNQAGDVLATAAAQQPYCGDKAPSPNAAFAAGTSGKLDAEVAANGKGLDGKGWQVVH